MGSKTVFGVALETVMARPGETVVPSFVKQLLLQLNRDEILKEEGIFRIACRDSDLKSIRSVADQGGKVAWTDYQQSPHVLAGVLRLYLRELPEPLIGEAMIPDLLRASETPDAASRLSQFRRVLNGLSKTRRQFLEVLLLFFSRVAENEEWNKMGAANLSVIFNQVFLRQSVETIESMMEMPKFITVVRMLIESFEDLFASPPSAASIPGGQSTVLQAVHAQDLPIMSPRGAVLPASARASNRPETVTDRAVLVIESTVQTLGKALRELQQRLDTTDSFEEALEIAERISAASAILKREAQAIATANGAQLESKVRSMRAEGTALSLTCGKEAQQGRRPKMEDADVVLLNVATVLPEGQALPESAHPIAYLGVYDGHGSDTVAHYAAEHLHKNVLTHEAFGEGRVEEALRSAFQATDKTIIATAKEAGLSGGTTVVVAVVVDRKLYVANLGDSEAVLASQSEGDASVVAQCLSNKHSPSSPEESERIRAAGGRVIFGRVFGDIAVARSLGDAMYKEPEMEKDLLSADPSVRRFDLSPDDLFLILACDGIWDVFTYNDAVQFVRKMLDEGHGPDSCCKQLVAAAIEKGSLDNCTCVIAIFDWS